MEVEFILFSYFSFSCMYTVQDDNTILLYKLAEPVVQLMPLQFRVILKTLFETFLLVLKK